MKNFTSHKVIITLVIAIGVLAFAYYNTNQSLNRLSNAVNRVSQPDEFSAQLQKLNNSFIESQSGIRAFKVSQDEKHLEEYSMLRNNFPSEIDSLKKFSPGTPVIKNLIEDLEQLAASKFELYEELRMISFTRIFDSTFITITEQLPVKDSILSADTIPVIEKKKNFFEKIFGSSGPSKKEMQATVDSVLKKQQEQRANTVVARKKIEGIKSKQQQLIQQQSERELYLLKEDERISSRINSLITYAQELNASLKKQTVQKAELETGVAISLIKWLMLGGGLIIIALLGMILLDISKSNQYRNQLADAKVHAEALAKSKEEFLTTMSHELRTPLSAILGYIGRLSKTELSEKQGLYIKSLQSSSEHLLSIVNDILDLTKADAHKFVFESISFSPFETVKEVCDVLKIKADEKSISLKVAVSQISGVSVKGDPLRLKQVLFNIIGNAVKFTDSGNVTVSVNAKRSDSFHSVFNFHFTIKDTGPGIPQAKLKTLFTQFTQADASINRKFGGSGLGLNISKKIAEQQGGEITVESEFGNGSTFKVMLPYEVVTEQVSEAVHFIQTEKAPEKKLPRPLEGISVLLAEDVEINRSLQTEMLKDFGAKVTAVDNGKAVIFELNRSSPHILIMDIQMPEMSGTEAIRVIRNDLNIKLPVLATTANVVKHTEGNYTAAGFDDVIIKPFREEELLHKVLSLISKKAVNGQPAEKALGATEGPLYDLNELIKSSKGNYDFVARMLKIFIKSADSILEKANAGAVQKNWSEVAAQSHKLIPSCRQLSIDDMATRLKRIEDSIIAEKNEAPVEELLNEITEVFKKVSFALQEEITRYENLKNSKA